MDTREAKTGDGTVLASIARIEERLFSLRAHVDTLFAKHEEAHVLDRAIAERSRTELNSRLVEANGVRDEMREQLGRFAPREQLGSEIRRLESLADRIDSELDRRTQAVDARLASTERAMNTLQGTAGEVTSLIKDIRELRDWRSASETTFAQVSIIAKEVDGLKNWRSENQGRGAIIAVVVSAAVSIAASVVVGLILFVAMGGG